MRIVRSRASSLTSSLGGGGLTELTPQQKEARENWGRMFQKLLPSVRAQVAKDNPDSLFMGALSGGGAAKLVEL